MNNFAEKPKIPSLAGQTRYRLESLIDDPEWRGGGRLPPEEDLARQLDVSRPTLRKALGELRDSGRIVSRRGSGNFVQPMADVVDVQSSRTELKIRTVYDMKRCVNFRTKIECAAAEEAGRQKDAVAIDSLKLANKKLTEAGSQDSIFEADFAFHIALAQATLNPYYPFVLETIKDQIRLTIEFTRKLAGRPLNEVEPRVAEEHQDILNAVELGLPNEAREAMYLHMQQTMKRLLGE